MERNGPQDPCQAPSQAGVMGELLGVRTAHAENRERVPDETRRRRVGIALKRGKIMAGFVAQIEFSAVDHAIERLARELV